MTIPIKQNVLKMQKEGINISFVVTFFTETKHPKVLLSPHLLTPYLIFVIG